VRIICFITDLYRPIGEDCWRAMKANRSWIIPFLKPAQISDRCQMYHLEMPCLEANCIHGDYLCRQVPVRTFYALLACRLRNYFRKTLTTVSCIWSVISSCELDASSVNYLTCTAVNTAIKTLTSQWCCCLFFLSWYSKDNYRFRSGRVTFRVRYSWSPIWT